MVEPARRDRKDHRAR
jgi:hypothetical protein